MKALIITKCGKCPHELEVYDPTWNCGCGEVHGIKRKFCTHFATFGKECSAFGILEDCQLNDLPKKLERYFK